LKIMNNFAIKMINITLDLYFEDLHLLGTNLYKHSRTGEHV